MLVFVVAIFFAPAPPNEISPATDNDHEVRKVHIEERQLDRTHDNEKVEQDEEIAEPQAHPDTGDVDQRVQ
jgi:hypothetical protein